jgi:hypothetical protein
MARIDASAAEIVSEDPFEDSEYGSSPDQYEPLARWVVAKVDSWRTWRDGQYAASWDEWERLWRGVWSTNERLRESERSKIVSPALSEAVENGAAEIEEATFGRGTDYFDISAYDAPPDTPEIGANAPEMGAMGQMPGMAPPMPMKSAAQATRDAVEKVRTSLKEDLARSDFAAATTKCILNSGVFGMGVGEIVTKTYKVKSAGYDPVTNAPAAEVREVSIGTLRSVSPRNFVYDSNATSVDDALGVAVEENQSKHIVQMAQRNGDYRPMSEVDVCEVQGEADPSLSGDQVDSRTQDLTDAIHVIKYYGLVPRNLLYPRAEGEEFVDLFESDNEVDEAEEEGDYVEAIVVVGNKSVCLKAEANPYVMGDRPIVIFPWDVVPGRLNGRGLCEKGANSQKILDAEIRARLDALALTTVPMMGMDANRVPRGAKFLIKPGATFLTSGNPAEVLVPFKFGTLDANHWTNMQALQAMVQQATGSVDATAMAAGIGDARSGAVSMALAPVIKRYKRTMVNFLDTFLMPAVEKITYRNMQTMPDRYPAVALKFKAASTMGIMQREYETAQLTMLLNTLEPGTPEHRAVLTAIVGNTSIPNREAVLQMIAHGEERAAQAAAMAQQAANDPMAMQLKMASIQADLGKANAEIEKLKSETTLNYVKAEEMKASAEIEAMQVASKGLYALPAEQQAAEFDRRFKLTQLAIQQASLDEKRADRESNERIANTQMMVSAATNERTRKLEKALEEAQNEEIEIEFGPDNKPVKARTKRRRKAEGNQGATQ